MPETFTFEEAQTETFSFEEAQPHLEVSHDDPALKAGALNLQARQSGYMQPDTEFTAAMAKGARHGFPEAQKFLGDVARAIPADVADTLSRNPQNLFQPGGGNLLAALSGEQLPIDDALALAAWDAKDRGEFPTAATVGKISQGIAATSPMLALGVLPKAAQQAALVGFTGMMLLDAPHIANELESELGKPEEERDPDRISTLVSDYAQISGFSLAGGVPSFRAIRKAGETIKGRFAPRETRPMPDVEAAAIRGGEPITFTFEEAKAVRPSETARPDVRPPETARTETAGKEPGTPLEVLGDTPRGTPPAAPENLTPQRIRRAELIKESLGDIYPFDSPGDFAHAYMPETLTLPPGWSMNPKDIVPSKHGSVYWHVTDPMDVRWKLSVRDHPKSDVREREFGPTDIAVYVKNVLDPEQFAGGMDKLEARLAAIRTKENASPSEKSAEPIGQESVLGSGSTKTGVATSSKPAEPVKPQVTVTERHLKEARAALATERPPDIFDELDAVTRGKVKFAGADYAEALANARGAARERMSANKGTPADQALRDLAAQDPKFADWTEGDLANAMLDHALTRIESTKGNRPEVRQLAAEIAAAEKKAEPVTDWDQAAAAVLAEKNSMLVGSYGSEASGGGLNPKFPVLLGGVDALRPLEMPEIVRLSRDLTGDVPSLKRFKRYLGLHKGGKITLDARLFADPVQAAQVLAHELGHANDFFPEGTMSRGNLIGRVIGSTRKFLAGHDGWLRDKKLREELVALSNYWHPWERDKAPESYRKYRDSSKELYADALSVLLNSPGLLEQKAPTFYRAFFHHLDKKPKFKEEFFALQDLLARGPEAVMGERLAQSREGFEKGEAILHEKIQLRQAARNSFKDFLTKVRIQSLDIASHVRRKLGSKDPRNPSEFDRLYEEWKLDDNRNAADLQRIYHEMIQPVVKTGLDEHHFGQVLELQRIIGGLDAYKDMQSMRQTLGPGKMAVLSKASDKLAELERKGTAETEGLPYVEMLDRAGIPYELIDTYRQLATTQGTRAELANPQGRSPVLAEAELQHLLATVTPEQRAALLDASARFRQLIFERATEARDVGIISKLTHEKTIVPNKDNYAAFRPLDKIEPFVSPMVRRARGTLNDVENPFITTLLKLQSLNNLIELQKVKNLVRDQFTKLTPADFKPAATRWTGRRMEAVPAKPGVGRVKILEDGRLKEYDTDPYIAKMFDQLTPTDSFWLNKLLEVPFRMGVYPLIIKYNPGFLFAFNPRRDMARTIRNLYAVEGVTRRELLPNYAKPEVWKAVSDYLEGRPNPLAEAMIRNKAITTSWQGFARLDQQDVMTDLLRRYKLAAEPTKSSAMRALMWLPDKINQGGSFLEALPKFASYKTLIDRGVAAERASYLVRNYAGTPNFKVKGEAAYVSNAYAPFINIFLQGWKADLKLALNPKTAAGWWMQWFLQHGWQAVSTGLAAAGVFGDDVKRLYAGISEYDKTNYGVLPLGTLPGGDFGSKTVYVRFPRDETSRFFSAITYKATRALADWVMGNPEHPEGLPTEIFAFGSGMTPSPSPILNTAAAWKDYLAGRNPIDPFRNQPVIGARNFEAGGFPALRDMLTWTLNQSGALNLVRFNPKAETTTEAVVGGVPVLNRLLKVSDAGNRESQLNDKRRTTQDKAHLRIKYGEVTQTLAARHAWLQYLGAARRTPEQERLYQRLHDWKSTYYDPADAAAWDARQNRDQQKRVIHELERSAERLKKELKR